ncbi:hypothetical protein BH09ACT10_BH09ACT10_12430 [soil metagenome]
MTQGSSNGKFHASILVVVIAAMSTALYVSPTGKAVRSEVKQAIPFVGEAKTTPPSASLSAAKAKKAKPTAAPTAESSTIQDFANAISDEQTPPDDEDTPTPNDPDPSPSPTDPAPTDPAPTNPVKKIEGCWSFTYQQDAQAFYVADVSDPLGLDGAMGPSNGDGLACTHLPRDSARAASIPFGAYKRTFAAKSEMVSPTKKHFGVAEDGVPGDSGLMDSLARQVGKAPSMVEWFGTWDEEFNASKVDKAWDRGALPIITWMPAHKGNVNASDISLQKIVDGNWDEYVTEYAKAVAANGEPVVLRFAHEQNGNWYPWSAGGNRAIERGDRGDPYFNTPALFKQAWQHVWDIFEANDANKQAIWAWTPVRVDDINANLTDKSRASYGLSDIADSYPGDKYVDWVGVSGYAYKGTDWTYANTFSKSLTQLSYIAPTKPILIAETGASETSGAQDNRVRKAAWIADTLQGLATDPRIVGFVWFNNTVVDVHTVDGIKITTDNKWDSSPDSLAAFIQGIADPVWMTGTTPDTEGANEAAATSPATTP